jgi:hypothetical protein
VSDELDCEAAAGATRGSTRFVCFVERVRACFFGFGFAAGR